MTASSPQLPGNPPPVPSTSRARSVGSRIWSTLQLVVALAITAGFLAYLLKAHDRTGARNERAEPPKEVVQVVGEQLLRILPDTPLSRKLQIAVVKPTRATQAMIEVTGTVAASLRPGGGKGNDYWQFNAPEVLTAYTDWQKAESDIAFSETQLARIKELAETRVEAQKRVVDRLKKLVDAGTDTPKDLAVETTNLLQYQIQGQKEVHEAETAVRIARRNEAALARQLQQAGLESSLLRSATSDLDIVMADVPEGYLSRVRVGQACEARFFGISNQVFSGKVNSIAPVISKERRSLRVLFVIDDPKDQLRPGMFAEIGLGTDAREALFMPAEGVVHLGRAEYVLVAADEANVWRVAEVQVGEPQEGQLEILAGLKAGDRVLGKGTILLKPAIQKALATPALKSGPAEGKS